DACLGRRRDRVAFFIWGQMQGTSPTRRAGQPVRSAQMHEYPDAVGDGPPYGLTRPMFDLVALAYADEYRAAEVVAGLRRLRTGAFAEVVDVVAVARRT